MATLQVNSGRAIVTARLVSNSQVVPAYVAIGSGAGTTGQTDTSLFTEYTTGTWTGYARSNVTPTQQTTTTTNDTVQFQATFTAPASETVTNAGNFDAASTGNMHVKGDFTGIALSSGDSLQVTIKVAYS